jgi:amino acid permease
MSRERKGFIVAASTLTGTIIGVGIFGVPYAISGIGAVTALLYFLVLGGIQLLQHLYYAEAAMATPEKLRLPGLIEKYLGRKAKHVVAVSTIFGFWAGQLAYIIVGGTFLHVLFSPWLGGQAFHYQIGWAIIGSTIIFFGLNFIAKVDFWATIGLLIALLAILGYGVPHIRADHFVLFAGRDYLLPYGVILFSLSGLSAIPEMEDMLGGSHRYYRRAIVLGTLVAAVLTASFGYVVWGVTGPATSEAVVIGLQARLGQGIASLTAAFGFLAVATSYFAFGLNLRSTFIYDYKLRHVPAWLLTVGVPIALFLIGTQSFTKIISFSGAVFGGITAVAVALLYVVVTKRKLVKEKPLGLPLWLAYLSIAILTVGAAYEVIASAKDLLG